MPRTRSRIFRRPASPFWQAVWTDAQGLVHRQSTGCRDHAAAAAWLAARELERSRAALGIPTARPIQLALATAEYVAEREPSWSKGWAETVDGFFAHRVLPHFGNERVVSTVTRADVERFRSTEIGRPRLRGGAPVSDATVNRMMAALAAFGEWCLVEGRAYHVSNPWAGHAPLAEDETPVPALEEEQIARVLAALEQPTKLETHGRRRYRYPWRAIVELMRETGLRKSELARARADDCRGETLFVVSTRKRGRTKGRRMRPVPLSPRALELLEALPAREDGLLVGPIGDPRSAFRTAARAAGLERLWLHLWRHLFASRLAERGAGRHELRDAGGWSSGRMADRYTHARMERLRDLVRGPEAESEGRTGRALEPEKETGGSE
jgi:integrase